MHPKITGNAVLKLHGESPSPADRNTPPLSGRCVSIVASSAALADAREYLGGRLAGRGSAANASRGHVGKMATPLDVATTLISMAMSRARCDGRVTAFSFPQTGGLVVGGRRSVCGAVRGAKCGRTVWRGAIAGEVKWLKCLVVGMVSVVRIPRNA